MKSQYGEKMLILTRFLQKKMVRGKFQVSIDFPGQESLVDVSLKNIKYGG